MPIAARSALRALVLALAVAGFTSPLTLGGAGNLAVFIPRMADDDFAVRESATAELLRLGRLDPEPVLEFCFRQLRDAADPEVRSRCRKILRDLLSEDTGFIGIRHARYRFFGADGPPMSAAVITELIPGLPAIGAGLLIGDIVTRINGAALDNGDPAGDLSSRIAAAGSETRIVLTILRGGQPQEIAVTTARRPAEFQDVDPELRLREWIAMRLAKERQEAEADGEEQEAPEEP